MRMPLTVWGLWLTVDPQRAVRAGARLGGASCLLLDRLVRARTSSWPGAAVGPAATRCSSSTCSGSSGTQRSTSSSCRPGASSATSSRSSRASRRYWYKGTVFAMIAVTVLSAVVYGHHMYQTGMAPLLGLGFKMLTLDHQRAGRRCSFVNWLDTIWKGSHPPRRCRCCSRSAWCSCSASAASPASSSGRSRRTSTCTTRCSSSATST